MTHLIRHTWVRQAFAVVAIAAILVATGSQLASANKEFPQDITKKEAKELCDLTGGDWNDYGSDGFACSYNGWTMGCDGATCQIACWPGTPCIGDQKVVEPTTPPTPSPRDRGRSTTADEPMVVATDPTPTPTSRGRGRTTIADEPVFVAPVSTPTPSPITIESPTFDPAPVVIDPA